MHAFIAVLSFAIVFVGTAVGAWLLLGPTAFALLAAVLGFFGLMAVCAKFWATS